MPQVPDASSVTQFRRARATIPADVTIKSRTYLYVTKDGYQSSLLRASQVGLPSETVLSVPPWKSPRFNGRIFLK